MTDSVKCAILISVIGTKVGDPIETNAAGKVFSGGRDVRKPLRYVIVKLVFVALLRRLFRVGSVKSNIGHTEGCSFLASLVKVSLMLHHKEIIPNIRFTKANPKIDFPALKMQVQTEVRVLLVFASSVCSQGGAFDSLRVSVQEWLPRMENG